MLGKRKRNDKQAEESENSNSLYKESKKDIDQKNFLISKLKKTNESFSKIFLTILKSMANFSKSLSALAPGMENKTSQSFEKCFDCSNDSNKVFQLLDKILKVSDSPQVLEEFVSELNVHLESIENKLTNLISNLLNTKLSKNNNQITKFIEEGINDEMVEFFNKEAIEENKKLRNELNKIKELLEETVKKNNLDETEFLKINLENKSQELSDLNKKLEEMKIVNRQIKQKLNSSPYLPYILLEGAYATNVKNHNCLCYYCGFDINAKETENANEALNYNLTCVRNTSNALNQSDESAKIAFNQEMQQDVIMNDVSNNNSNKISGSDVKASNLNENEESNKIGYPSFKRINENVNLNLNQSSGEAVNRQSMPLNDLTHNQSNVMQNIYNSPHVSTDNDLESLEKQNLNNLYKRLYEAYLNLKCEKTYSYQSILKSKPFQLLLTQIENAVNVIENQKLEITLTKKQLNEIYNELKSQEKLLKLDKMKDVSSLELKIESLQKEIANFEGERAKFQAEISKNEEMIKTLKNFDYSQLNAIEEYYANKNTSVLEMIKTQVKTYSDKFQAEFEKAETLEKQNLKLTIELDRFKTALSKHEKVEGVENPQYEKFDMREREEMKRQIKSYKDKYTNCEKSYRSLKGDLKIEKENSEKLFMEIVLNEKGTEQMNKTIKELTNSIQENNEKIAFLLNEKQKNTETIRSLNDYIEKLESEIKDISEIDKEMLNIEENFLKELKTKQEIIKKLEILVKFKNSNIDALYNQITQLTKENLSLNNSNSELIKTIDSLKNKNSKKITELQVKLEKSIPLQRREFNKSNMVFSDKKAEDEFEMLKLENDTFRKKILCKICSIRDINVILNKCNHTFCRECIENLISSRQRICPKCRCKISMTDVSDIWLD